VKYILLFSISRASGNDVPISVGFGLVVGLFFLQLIGTLLLNYFFQVAATHGITIRTTLSTVIYRKTLRLSAAARQDFNSGKGFVFSSYNFCYFYNII
jgi:ATP-binding cassette, subfamily C (CFTR/MRP), member 1